MTDSKSTSPPPTVRQAQAAITAVDVTLAADALLRQGLRPTIERIRGHLGRGSPNTINPLLDQWWKTLATRLSGGADQLDRIPAAAFHALEALWVKLHLAARDRAAQDITRERDEAIHTAQSLEIRSHVLSLRESELNERLRRQEDRVAALEAQLQSASLSLRRAEVERASASSRTRTLEAELREARGKITELLRRTGMKSPPSVKKNAALGGKRTAHRPTRRKRTVSRIGKARTRHR